MTLVEKSGSAFGDKINGTLGMGIRDERPNGSINNPKAVGSLDTKLGVNDTPVGACR